MILSQLSQSLFEDDNIVKEMHIYKIKINIFVELFLYFIKLLDNYNIFFLVLQL